MFLARQIFLESAPEFLEVHYKIYADTDHVAKFHVDRPTELGDLFLWRIKKNITTKTEGLRN